MPFIKTRDGTEIFYKDWGAGQPIVFSHGWPLSADSWDPQLVYFASRGYRVIAHDRRSHGRSTQTWDGNHMDQYADDLSELIEKLDIRNIIMVVHDQLATGSKLRILTVVDLFSRFSPVIDPRFSYRGEDVVATLERVCADVGYPDSIRVDQGSEFISRDLDLWAYQNNVTLDFSRPGKPTDNAFIEAFNGRLRAECLNTHWFLTLEDAGKKLENWRRHYNEVRPHGAIGNKAPITLIDRPVATSPTGPLEAEFSGFG